jgi:hypothetical protein
MSTPPNPRGDQGGGGNPDARRPDERSLHEPPSCDIDTKHSTPTSMEVEATLPSNSSPPPTDTTTPDPIAVSNNAVDDEDISDEETVLTRGSNGPRPSKLLNQPIARDLTLNFLIQSTEELSTREVAGRFLNLLHAVVSMKAVMPNVVYDKNKQPMRNFSQDNASNFEKKTSSG